jgi:probable phosphoglycerate mutase
LLTAQGRDQAKALGKKWSNVRIDHLYSSILERALDTALEISTQNISHPEIEKSLRLVEHHWGYNAIDYSNRGMNDQVRYELGGFGPGVDRNHVPSGGGESYNNVASRAREFVESQILGRFGVCLSEVPESLTNEETAVTAETLPEGIPHIVIVSHNVFLTELYEGLLYWNKDHKMTDIYWPNAGW